MIDELRYRRLRMIKDLMSNPLFGSAMAEVRQSIAQELLATKTMDCEAREDLYMESIALDRIIGRLTSLANECTYAEGKVDKPQGAA